MKKEHTTKTYTSQQMVRWKRILSVLTLTLISLCAIISLMYVSGVLSEMLEMSTLFAIFTAVFSILVPCCICLTLITLSKAPKDIHPDFQNSEDEQQALWVDFPHGEVVYGKERIRCRQQILLILQYMTSKTDHFISKADFAGVLDDSSYVNDSDSANAKINTLVSNIRATLRALPYEIVNVNRQGYVLNKKTTEKSTDKSAEQG